jgi:hypothetical protein
MVSNWKDHCEASGRRFTKKAFSPDEDSEGLIFEGEFEEIIEPNEPETQFGAHAQKPFERRQHNNRRVKTARPLFETRAGDRRKSKRVLDIYT